ncbi:MAG TPA: hypothetical protein VMF08_18575 [Candidatus Sulfotelmatobacter sp.]|nr:hypothetical protein [Candidatus Sulfotelmatobacter sp.]
MKPIYYSAFLACLSLFLAGCAANVPYRTSLPDPPAGIHRPTGSGLATIDPITNAVIETHTLLVGTNQTSFKIGYVEFDDQGWFWGHQQWQAVKQAIGEEETNSRPNGLEIVVFVHGWKNNANYTNGDVVMFRQVLADLSANLYPSKVKVFGVYLGWRGWSILSDYFPIPLGQELTFYHRKAVAERIGHEGAATEVFTELQIMQQRFNDYNNSNGVQRTGLVIVGHSFGGQLVFSAISQILTERVLLAQDNQPFPSFGDLVVLVNPAFEASLYNNLIALATAKDIHYPAHQPPVLAVFTSRGDTATRNWFPRGRFFPALIESFRPGRGTNEEWLFNIPKNDPPNQSDAFRETIGHDEDYINYDLNYTNFNSHAATRPHFSLSERQQIFQTIRAQQETLAFNNTNRNITNYKPYYFTNSINGTNYACILQPRTNDISVPFINAEVDTHIIRNHDDINNPIFLQFLQAFILFTQTNYSEVQTFGSGLSAR